MSKGRFSAWMRRRMQGRIQRKLGLSEDQAARLMPILAKLRYPRHLVSNIELAEFGQVLKSETLDTKQLESLMAGRLNRFKQTLDEQAQLMLGFVSELDLSQRLKLQQMLAARHRCGHKMARG